MNEKNSPKVPDPHEHHHGSGRAGMLLLIVTESLLLLTFLVAYIFYMGKSDHGPQPKEVLEIPILATIVLLSSSITVEIAIKVLRRNKKRLFAILWLVTMLQGAYFLYATAMEWNELIYVHNLTISTNLFGTTFYSLVGAHAFHVIVGLLILCIVLFLVPLGHIHSKTADRVELVSWYWHFVDAVWVFVFTTVYLLDQ